MQPFLVHSTKYDGSLHYRRQVSVVHEANGLLMLYGGPGVAIESYRGQRITGNHVLEFYWNDQPFNLNIMWHADWRPRMHYVNIATPATWADGVLHFIDLDLDLIWRAGSTEVQLDDEDEFLLHQVQFGYPPELIAQAWQASAEVHRLFAQRIPPFDGSMLAWRPDHGVA